jgi:hypothetical protein
MPVEGTGGVSEDIRLTRKPEVELEPASPLSPEEEQRLAGLRAEIDRERKGYWHLGRAVRTIRDERLYRASGRFEDFVRKELGWARSTAYAYITAANVVDNLVSAGADIPPTQRHAEILSVLPPERQVELAPIVATMSIPDGRAFLKQYRSEFQQASHKRPLSIEEALEEAPRYHAGPGDPDFEIRRVWRVVREAVEIEPEVAVASLDYLDLEKRADLLQTLPEAAERLVAIRVAADERDQDLPEGVEPSPPPATSLLRVDANVLAELGGEERARRMLKARVAHKRRMQTAAAERERLIALGRTLAAAGPSWQVIYSDIRDLDLEPESLDLICTDHPYPPEYAELDNVLGARALHALVPGGSLLCMTSTRRQFSLQPRLEQYLDFNDSVCYSMKPPTGRAYRPGHGIVGKHWKPVLWFSKGEASAGTVSDLVEVLAADDAEGQRLNGCSPLVVVSPRAEKDLHPDQQSVEGFIQLIKPFCRPGGRVWDPFAGSSTTGVAALRLGCEFIGSDYNEECVAISIARLTAESSSGTEGPSAFEGRERELPEGLRREIARTVDPLDAAGIDNQAEDELSS